jgi:hypothetical protein
MDSTVIAKILAETNEKGKFLASVVTDREGFTIASASTGGQNPEIQGALVGLIQRMTSQASDQLGILPTAEFTLFDTAGNRFVCRPFFAKGIEMVLAFLIPGKDQSYRRIMSQTIDGIQQAFDI